MSAARGKRWRLECPPGAHDLVFTGVTVAGASDLGILADTAFERRVYAVHGLPTSGNSNAHP